MPSSLAAVSASSTPVTAANLERAAALSRRTSTQSLTPSQASTEAQEGSPSDTIIDVGRLIRRPNSRSSWSPHPPRPRYQAPDSEGALTQAFEDGSSAATYLGLNALTSCSAATFLTDGVLTRDAVEIGIGVGLMVVAALDALLAEHKTRKLVRELGDFAPRGLSGPHALTQIAFGAGGSLYTFGVDRQQLETCWAGLAVLSVAWLSTSIQLSRLIDAMSEAPIALPSHPSDSGALETHVATTSDITGNPWAVVMMLLGSHGAGQAIAARNEAAAVFGIVAALCSAELAHQSRQGDTLVWLVLSGVGAGALGYTALEGASWLRFAAGLTLGVGAIHNLYHRAPYPVVRAQARRRHCPTLIPAMD